MPQSASLPQVAYRHFTQVAFDVGSLRGLAFCPADMQYFTQAIVAVKGRMLLPPCFVSAGDICIHSPVPAGRL